MMGQRRAHLASLRLLARFGAQYLLLALASIALSRQPGGIATLWLASSLTLAYLLTQPASRQPALFACAGLLNVLANMLTGATVLQALLFALANMLEVGLALWLVRRTQAATAFEQSPERLLRFLLVACCIPPLLGATVAAIAFATEGIVSFAHAWPRWYAGATIGAVGSLPVLLLMLQNGPRATLRRVAPRRVAPYALLCAVVDVVAMLYLPFPFVFMMVPLIVAAVTLSFETTALLVLLSTLTAGVSLATGHAGSALHLSADWQRLVAHLALLLTMIPPLVLAASTRQGRLRDQGRRQVERQLARQHAELQTIIDHMPAMIGYWDADLRNRFANRSYQGWFGMSPQQIRGSHLRDVIGAHTFELNQPYIAAVLRGDSPVFERMLVDQAGARRQLLATYVPDRRGGRVVGFYAFGTDITQLKRAQRDQREARSQLQGIVDAASEFAIIATGIDGGIEVFSAGAEQMLGYRADELVGHAGLLQLLPPEEVALRAGELSSRLGLRVAGFDVLAALARQGQGDRREWTYVRKDGGQLPVNLTLGAIGDADGATIGYLAIAHDITHQRQVQATLVMAKEQAEAASRAKSEFVANMSHEIRTPLNAVLGMAHLLDSTALSPDQKTYLEMIRVSGQSLLSILNDILDFSKIEAGRIELEPAPFALEDVLNALAGIMTVNAGEKDLELAIGIGADVPRYLEGDALRLQQVLTNLAGNAIKFTERGEVAVLVERVAPPPGDPFDHIWLQFSIRDTGIGIDGAQRERLFMPFSQADSSTTRRFGGTGLGLAISGRLTEMMGGQIDIDSTPGAGSTFAVTLPMGLAPQPARDDDMQWQDRRLLVVDDNATSRTCLNASLRAWGMEVDLVASGADALQTIALGHAQGRRYDAVLVAWQMPGMDGLATMDALRAAPRETPPVLLMTNAFGRGKLLRERAASRADAILIKPITGASLFAALHDVFEKRDGVARSQPFEPRAPSAQQRIDGSRLLLVEDNPLNQIVAKSMLEQAGASVDTADNGMHAIERLRSGERQYDLILMDVQMPLMDGYKATRIIREELGLTLPVLAMTAGVMESERAQCSACGMDGFIAKPIDVPQMFAAIAQYLPARRVREPSDDAPQAVALPAGGLEAADDGRHSFDPQPLMLIAHGNEVLRAELLALMRKVVERGPLDVDDARGAWVAGRASEAARVFHALRGSVGTLGARRFAALALDIEQAIKNDDRDVVPGLIDSAQRELNLTVGLARRWLEREDGA